MELVLEETCRGGIFGAVGGECPDGTHVVGGVVGEVEYRLEEVDVVGSVGEGEFGVGVHGDGDGERRGVAAVGAMAYHGVSGANSGRYHHFGEAVLSVEGGVGGRAGPRVVVGTAAGDGNLIVHTDMRFGLLDVGY